MNEEAFHTKSNLEPRNFSNLPCASLSARHEAADSLLSLLRAVPPSPASASSKRSHTHSSAPPDIQAYSSGKQECHSFPLLKHAEASSPKYPRKRPKLLIKANSKENKNRKRRVTFANDLVQMMDFPPFQQGLSDGECLQLYRSDIWYSGTDYESFWKDRIDTIRVYRSVNGAMSGLSDHYSTRGLEPYLQFHRHVAIQQEQKALVAAVLAEQHRQKLIFGGVVPDPEALQDLVTRRSSRTLEEAVARAALDVVSTTNDTTSRDGVEDDGLSVAEEEEDDDDDDNNSDEETPPSLPEPKQASVQSNSLQHHHMSMNRMSTTHHRPTAHYRSARPFAVNLASLRAMNRRLLQEMKGTTSTCGTTTTTNKGASNLVQRRAAPFLSSTTTSSALSLRNVDEEVTQWSRMLQQRREALRAAAASNLLHSRSTPLTLVAHKPQMMRHPHYHRRPILPPSSSSGCPSLQSLQFQSRLRLEQLEGVRIGHRPPAATSIAICRRDSLSGLR